MLNPAVFQGQMSYDQTATLKHNAGLGSYKKQVVPIKIGHLEEKEALNGFVGSQSARGTPPKPDKVRGALP